jgi:hypothetical protein
MLSARQQVRCAGEICMTLFVDDDDVDDVDDDDDDDDDDIYYIYIYVLLLLLPGGEWNQVRHSGRCARGRRVQ